MIRRTSIETYHRIRDEGLLSPARWKVYCSLFECEPATAGEIAANIPGKKLDSVGNNVHARLGELRAAGVVAEFGERQCKITGNNVIQWVTTGNLPKGFKKEPKLFCANIIWMTANGALVIGPEIKRRIVLE